MPEERQDAIARATRRVNSYSKLVIAGATFPATADDINKRGFASAVIVCNSLMRFLRHIPLISIIPVAVMLCGAAYVIASDGATANQNTPLSITGPDGVCKTITNNSATGLSEYIPTATVAEWQSFYTHPPAGVTVAACAPACAGKSVGGYCWYTTATSQNCDSACASHGGCNAAGTASAGSSGSDAMCSAVLDALGYPLDSVYGHGVRDVYNVSLTEGCVYYASGPTRLRYYMTTICGPTYQPVAVQRACACNN